MPILVVGPGRCGTSAVAKLLHEMGVFMGGGFVAGNESNPGGHWEDVDFHNLDAWRLDGKVEQADWERGVRHLAAMRSEPWGFKDPRTAHFVKEYVAILAPRFVRCRRPEVDVVASMCRWYGWTEAEARELAEFREAMLDHHLDGSDVLDVSINDLAACCAHAMIKEFLNA